MSAICSDLFQGIVVETTTKSLTGSFFYSLDFATFNCLAQAA